MRVEPSASIAVGSAVRVVVMRRVFIAVWSLAVDEEVRIICQTPKAFAN